MNYKLVFHILGMILRVEAVLMLPAAVIGLATGQDGSAFLLSAGITLAVGQALVMLPGKNMKMQARDGFAAVALSWIVLSLFGALPYVFSGVLPNYADAVFETVSGFTTTGASILTDVEAMGRGLLFWRSFPPWVGGMGVLVFLLAIVPMRAKNGGSSVHLLRAESPGPSVSKLVPKMRQTAAILYGIYIALTVVNVLFLLAGNMPLFDSLCTAFGTAGTGGFGIKNDSMAGYSPYLQSVCTVFMALFGINFSVYFMLLSGRFRQAFFNEEVLLYLGIMGGSIALITGNILSHYGQTRQSYEPRSLSPARLCLLIPGSVSESYSVHVR